MVLAFVPLRSRASGENGDSNSERTQFARNFRPMLSPEDPEREDRRQAVGNGCSGAPLGPRGVILRHGLAREHELAKVQRRGWPQRDSNPCFSHDHVFASSLA